jgi:hypothetical protein
MGRQILLICWAIIAVGVLVYQLSKIQRERTNEPAPIATTITPSTITLEPVPFSDDKLPFANDSPLKADETSWTDTMSRYRQVAGQKNQKGNRAESERLLNRLVDWMNKGAN